MSEVVRRALIARAMPVAFVAVTVAAIAACAGEERGPNGELVLRGTVERVETEEGGTCWRLDTGRKAYELQAAQVPSTLLADGARAVLLAKPRAGGSFCKVGDIVDVVRVDSVTTPTETAER